MAERLFSILSEIVVAGVNVCVEAGGGWKAIFDQFEDVVDRGLLLSSQIANESVVTWIIVDLIFRVGNLALEFVDADSLNLVFHSVLEVVGISLHLSPVLGDSSR
jgi:hypothetical protein